MSVFASQPDGQSRVSGGPGSPDEADEPLERVCSAKGCRRAAVWALLWNNPRLHTEGRRKTWLACEEHRAHLESFLGTRSFLREVVPVDQS